MPHCARLTVTYKMTMKIIKVDIGFRLSTACGFRIASSWIWIPESVVWLWWNVKLLNASLEIYTVSGYFRRHWQFNWIGSKVINIKIYIPASDNRDKHSNNLYFRLNPFYDKNMNVEKKCCERNSQQIKLNKYLHTSLSPLIFVLFSFKFPKKEGNCRAYTKTHFSFIIYQRTSSWLIKLVILFIYISEVNCDIAARWPLSSIRPSSWPPICPVTGHIVQHSVPLTQHSSD